jgi:hypothetical protein
VFGNPTVRAVDAGPAALDDRLVDGARLRRGRGQRGRAAQNQAAGIERARPPSVGRRKAIFALLGYPLTSTVGVIAVVRARWSWRAMYRLRQRRISLGFLPSAVRRAT